MVSQPDQAGVYAAGRGVLHRVDGALRAAGGRGGVWPVAIMVGLLNIGWTFAFFNRQNMAAAMVLLLVLLGGSVLLTQRIFRCSKLAAALTLPYLVWLGFALVLNYAFILIN